MAVLDRTRKVSDYNQGGRLSNSSLKKFCVFFIVAFSDLYELTVLEAWRLPAGRQG